MCKLLLQQVSCEIGNINLRVTVFLKIRLKVCVVFASNTKHEQGGMPHPVRGKNKGKHRGEGKTLVTTASPEGH